jgi:hypothetical protein
MTGLQSTHVTDGVSNYTTRHNQSTHVTDRITVMSHADSLLQKISAAMDCLCQIKINWKLSHNLEK